MHVDNLCPAVFITGTDTGVGKTLTTAALARHLTTKGYKVGVMKPIETGVDDTSKLGQDGLLLRWAASATDPDHLICPYRLKLAASPHQAARKENIRIELEIILGAFKKLREEKDILLVEGAGGLMVPIRGGLLMSDLAIEMGTPCLLVTHPRLGTLNHTMLTTFSARAMSLDLCGMIINKMPCLPDEIEKEAPHLLSSLASCDLLGVFPEVAGTDQERVDSLAKGIEESPTYHWLKNALQIQI